MERPGDIEGGANPAQQRVIELLGAAADTRPQFDAELRHHLRADLEAGLGPLVEHLPEGEDLVLTKRRLSAVHGCEAKLLAEEDEKFVWTVPLARGSVCHKAIELSVHLRGEQPPLDLVDEAIARLTEGNDGLADWLRRAPEVERAELRGEANDRVAKFLECFPRLKARWRPVTESRLRVELCEHRILLIGRTDLTLGQADGTTAGKVVIDLKTGGFSPTHLDDLRFYALLETIRIGIPPRLLAGYYLDECRPHPEQVTEAVLHAAVARTVDGAERLVALQHQEATPKKRTGAACRWCPVRETCAEGRAYLEGGATTEAGDDDRIDDPLSF